MELDNEMLLEEYLLKRDGASFSKILENCDSIIQLAIKSVFKKYNLDENNIE